MPNKLEFDKIKSLHEQAKSMGSSLGQLDLASFSQAMQDGDQENDWSAGQGADNVVGSLSRGIDSGLASTGLPDLAGQVTGFIGSGADALAGRDDQHYEQIAQQVGQGIPRMGADLGLMLGGTALLATPAAPLGVGMIGAGVADAGVKGYSDTNSVKQGVTSAALMGLAPGIGSVGSKAGIGIMGKFAPGLVESGAARVAASQVGQQVSFLGADAGMQLINEQNPFTVDNLFAQAVGNIAFAPLMIREGMDVYRNTPKAAKPSSNTDLIQRSGLTEGETGARYVQQNDQMQLNRYLLGEPDAMLPETLKSGNLMNALKMTGLLEPSDNTMLQTETLLRREKGRELVQKAATVEDNTRLTERAAKLLEADPRSLVDTIKIIRATNEFQGRWESNKAASDNVAQGLLVSDGKQVAKGKVKSLEQTPNENDRFAVKGVNPFDPNAQPYERDIALGEEPVGLRPKAVKGKSGDVVARSRAPEFSRVANPLQDSHVFRFVKGPLTHDGNRFLMVGSAQVGEKGLIHQNKFLSSTQMPKQVFELVKQVYPEAWEGEQVNVNKLRELEKTRPLVETHVYGQDGNTSAQKTRFDQINGELDIAGYHLDPTNGWLTARDGSVIPRGNAPQEIRAKVDEAYKLASDMHHGIDDGPKATSYYDSISPFDTTKYPVVRVDVTVPSRVRQVGDPKFGPRSPSDTTARTEPTLWSQDDLHENLPNTLGWAMVQFVPDPRTGETVMFVAEQQSRWGQDVAKDKGVQQKRAALEKELPALDAEDAQRLANLPPGTATVPSERGVQVRELLRKLKYKERGVPDHPLLDLQHKLVLKAAMDEARKRGVTKMVVSDGETAMMTERHDAHTQFHELDDNGQPRLINNISHPNHGKPIVLTGEMASMVKDKSRLVALDPSQAGGMRQHYDSVLQSAAEKMTRSKGETVGMGVHKNAVEKTDMRVEDPTSLIKGSPVFRNPDGTPKTTATGKMYDILPDIVDQAKYSKVGDEPTGANDKGFYTQETLRAETERLNNIEGTPEVAQARLMQKVKSRLAKLAGITQVDGQNPAMRLMSETFDNLGLAPGLKGQYMRAAQRIVDFIEVGPASYGRTERLSNDETARGIYFPQDHLITVKTTNGSNNDAESAAFNAVRVLAHESSHALHDLIQTGADAGIDSFRVRHLENATKFAEELSVGERTEILYKKFEELIPGVSRDSFKGVVDYSAGSAREFLTEYGALHAMMKSEPSVVRNALRFVPEPLQNFVKTLLRGMHEITKMVRGTKTNPTFENFHKDVEMLYAKDPVIEGLKSAMVESLQAGTAIEQGDLAGMGVRYSKSGIKALDEKVAEMTKVRQSGGFVRNVMQHMQISAGAFYKEHFPAYNKVTNSLATMDGMAVSFNHAIRRNFMVSVDGGLLKDLASLSDSKLTKEQIQQKSVLGRIEASEKLQRSAFDTMLKTNELVKIAGETGGEYPTFDHPEVQKVMEGLSVGQKADIQQVYHAYLEANATAARLQVKGEVQRIQYVAADYLLGAGIPHEQAFKAGVRLFDALLSGDSRNIPKELIANEGAIAFMKHWENVKPKFEEFQQKLDRPYFTEFRSGRWGVRYDVLDADGKVVDTGYRSTNDKQQWKAIQRDVANDKANRITELMDHQTDPKGRFGQMQTRGLEEATNLVRAHYDAAMAAMRPEMAALFEETMFDPAQPLVDKSNAELKTMALRRLAPGREKINMIAAQDAYSSLISRKLANTMTRLETNWQLKHESWQGDVPLKQEVQQFRDNILAAGRQEFQTFRKATTMVTMGGNVSSAIVDSLQPVTMGLWRATQEVGFAKALKYTSEGFAEAFKPIDKISDAGFKDVLVQAINRGYLKTGGALDDFMSMDDSMNYNVTKARSNRDLVDMKEMLTDSEFLAGRVMEQFSKLGQKGMEVAMTPMRLSAQLNNKNALWVGYKMGLDKGLKGQALFDAAVSTMQTINLQGQRAAHSSFKMKAGQANGLVEAATLMTNYPIAVFAEMTSSWQGMLKSSGLNAEQRRNSMQAFSGQVLTQMAFAGVAGMGLKGLFQFAKEMFGVDAEEAIRKGSEAIDESGTLGEVLLNGVVNSVTGIDVSSRFDLSGIGGMNPYTGFDAKGLFGAGGGMISALYNAPGQFAKGDVSKIQLIPTGVRRMMTAYGNDAYTDASGQQIINPTVNERFVQMLGFKPARMAQVLEQKSTMREIDKSVSEKTSQRKAQMVDLMQQGKMPEVMQNIQQDVLEEMQGVEYAGYDSRQLRELQQKLTRETMLELVNSGVEKLLPFDPMMQGSGAVAAAKSSSAEGFGNKLAPRQSEQARIVLKQQMMQQLGMKLPRNAPKAVRNAQMVDELIRQNPTMTRSQALAVLHGQ